MFLLFISPVVLIYLFSGFLHDKIGSILILFTVILILCFSIIVGFQKFCHLIFLKEKYKGENAIESSEFSKGGVVEEFHFLKYIFIKNHKNFQNCSDRNDCVQLQLPHHQDNIRWDPKTAKVAHILTINISAQNDISIFSNYLSPALLLLCSIKIPLILKLQIW